MTKTKHTLNNTAPEWHKGIEVIQAMIRSSEYTNDRLKEEIQRKEQFIQKQLTTVKQLKERLAQDNTPSCATKEIPVQVPEEICYTIGQKFHYLNVDRIVGHDTYILAQIFPGTLNLIGLLSGNRWSAPLVVPNSGKIPKSVFDAHFVGPRAVEWVLLP